MKAKKKKLYRFSFTFIYDENDVWNNLLLTRRRRHFLCQVHFSCLILLFVIFFLLIPVDLIWTDLSLNRSQTIDQNMWSYSNSLVHIVTCLFVCLFEFFFFAFHKIIIMWVNYNFHFFRCMSSLSFYFFSIKLIVLLMTFVDH